MSAVDAGASHDRRHLATTGGLLAAILVHNLIYPLTVAGPVGVIVFYLVYALMFVIAAWRLTRVRWLRLAIAASGAAVFVTGLINAFAPTGASGIAIYLASIVYHAVMIVVLARYTFAARTVMTDVLLAATSLYLVIGSMFAAIFASVEWFAPGSFASSAGAEITWQLLLYYSYVTLTTVGYGDITPSGFYAQAFAAFEAVIGVLYTVILLARLVGKHTSANE
ncbi:MAG: ion channel [Hyphomonadaceae bacterium]